MKSDLHRTVNHRQCDLSSEWDSQVTKLDAEAVFVDRFNESGAQLSVDPDRGSNDLLSQLLGFECRSWPPGTPGFLEGKLPALGGHPGRRPLSAPYLLSELRKQGAG